VSSGTINLGGWRQVEDALGGSRVHVIPKNDDREHQRSELCWCRPEQSPSDERMWLHNSADRREEYERHERKVN
jgi:hypothetical protein